jgi:cobalt-zinc-cadmium resistance protein CzcA
MAQQPITLKSAIDSAIHNNLLVKNEQLKAKYQQMLIPNKAVLPKMGITAEAGQINSIYNDSKFGLSQSFSFPKVYLNQRELMQQEWKSSLLNVSVKESLLKKQVAQIFYTILYVNQKKALLLQADSLYADLYKRAELRLSKGESNILEKVSIETQLGEVRLQLNQILQDLEILKIEFQLLLNTSSPYIPLESENKLKWSAILDSSLLKNHATLKLIEQQQQVANANIAVEKSKLLPDFSVGYNNSSIRGTGADNKFYPGTQRFSAVQLGVAIPVFARTQKDKVNAAKFNRELAAQEYQFGMQKLQTEYQIAFVQYKKHLETVYFFESKALKNASLIITTANQQLARGSINYLEWGQVIHQATLIKKEYLEALKNLNESIIQLNYLTNQ